MSELTVIVVKNNVPKVVAVTDKIKKIIEKAYYRELKRDKFNDKSKQ